MPYYAECYNEVVRRISLRPVVPVFASPMRAVDLSGFDPYPEVGQTYNPETNTFGPASSPQKRLYTFPRFIRELTDNEFATIETIATANTVQGKRARRVLSIWKAEGVDMNDPLTMNAVTAVLGEARAQELS